jgi:hypothetical protein
MQYGTEKVSEAKTGVENLGIRIYEVEPYQWDA